MADKTFAIRDAKFRKGLVRGTPEFAHRREYPGPKFYVPCTADDTCVRYAGGPKIKTYWLCPACTAPDALNDYRTHPPPHKLPGLAKVTQANRAAYLAYCLIHCRP